MKCTLLPIYPGKTFYSRLFFLVSPQKIYEPAHDKTCNKTCATSEDSDQPAHPHSLIRDFAARMCLLQSQGYPKKDKRVSLPYLADVQANLSLCWLHKSYCRFFVRWLIKMLIPQALLMRIHNIYSNRNKNNICLAIPLTKNYVSCMIHYENMPIQMYRKFHLQKLKNFR